MTEASSREVGFDTSGHVRRPGFAKPLVWSDLSPFEQGYVRAAMESFAGTEEFGLRWRFSDLAPSTLSAMLGDCEGWLELQRLLNGLDDRNSDGDGRAFYAARQEGQFESFPPQTLSLGEDGLIYAREG